jgi:hypothetical protein
MEQKTKPKKKGNVFSKLVISAIVLLNTTFTIAVLYIFFKVQSEPVVIIGAWFAFTTGELWMLAGIRKNENNLKSLIKENNSFMTENNKGDE